MGNLIARLQLAEEEGVHRGEALYDHLHNCRIEVIDKVCKRIQCLRSHYGKPIYIKTWEKDSQDRLTLSSLFQREAGTTYCKMKEVNDPSFQQRITSIYDAANESTDEDGYWRWVVFK